MTTARSLGDATLGLRADASQLEGDLDQAATSTEKKVQGIGKALTAALTGPILGIGAAVFASTEQINEAFATIQAGTGASRAKPWQVWRTISARFSPPSPRSPSRWRQPSPT